MNSRELGEEKLCLTVPEAAKLLGISRGLAYELAHKAGEPIYQHDRNQLDTALKARAEAEAIAVAKSKAEAVTKTGAGNPKSHKRELVPA